MGEPPTSKPLEGTFDGSLFQPRYQRNNKRGGLKNLRCFPICAEEHKERGFCGRPVFITLNSNEGERLLTWAEFLKSDEPRAIKVGSTISLAQAETNSRSKEEPLKPWIKGSFAKVDNGSTIFEFNREKRGWHYGWASNKHTCNANHVLVAWIFERSQVNPDELTCRGVIESPPFMLFCRRRRRFTIVPTAPTRPPGSGRTSKKPPKEEEEEDDDDEEEEDDDEEEPAPPKKERSSKTNSKKRPSHRSEISNDAKRPAIDKQKTNVPTNFPQWPLDGTSKSAAINTSTTLDKNRVDALLSLLLVAWRKLKDVEGGIASLDPGNLPALDLPVRKARHNTSSSASGVSAGGDNPQASPIAAQIDSEFFQMLDYLSGDMDFLEGFSLEPINVGSGAAFDDDYVDLDPDVEALAEYLLREPDFKQSVLWLRGQGSHPDFNAFIGILRDHVHKFMRERNWTVADIDRLIHKGLGNTHQIKSEPGTPWFNINEDALNWDVAAAAAEASAAAGSRSPRELKVGDSQYVVPNISGVWKQTRESQLKMEQVREKSGSSWVMSKIFEFMESKFTIQQNGLELSCRLWPMPPLKFVLDGEEHPWGIRFPLFQPNWTYRAWTDGKVITLQHEIENRRLTRRYWCDSSRRILYSQATLELYDAFYGKFVEESSVVQTAERLAS